MKDHRNKMAAPIVITILFLAYVIAYGVLLMMAGEWNAWFLLLAVPVAMLGAGMIIALIARIREIRSGEEDDLDNY